MRISGIGSGWLVLVFTFLAVSCGDNITDTGTDLPENRGSVLQQQVDVEFYTEIAWSPDGNEIYFESPGATASLFAATLSGGAPRQLDTGRDAYFDITASPAGDAVYFAADLSGGTRTSYRLPLNGGAPIALTSRAPSALAQFRADGKVALPSPSGATVAFTVSPDSVFTYGVAGGVRTFIATGCERIVTFSPSGAEVLCVNGTAGTGVYRTLTLATGAISDVTVLPPTEGIPMAVHWGAAGIRALYQPAFGGLSFWANGGRTDYFELPDRGGLILDARNSSWSSDGDRIAFWVHECLRRRGLTTCEEGQSILYIGEIGADRAGIVAVAHGEVSGQFIALSPAASRVAYTFEELIYHQGTSIPGQ
jgi:hypothetical protein